MIQFLLCGWLAASGADPSCVFLLNGDSDPPWGSTAWSGQPSQNHGATAAKGKFGGAVRFDGKGAYLDGGQYFGQGFSFPRQTISLWVRPERNGQVEGIVGSQAKPGQSSWRWSLVRETDGTIAFRIYDNAQADAPRREARSKTPAPVNSWTHVAVVIDTRKATARLFLNGKPVGTDRVQSNSPHGSLIVGHSLGGPYQGAVDELAIFERALSDEDVAALAARSDPLPEIEPRRWNGFWLRPRADTPFMGIRHSNMPDAQWVLRLTEYAYFDAELKHSVPAHDVAWTVDADCKKARFRWEADKELKQKVGLDFWGEYAAHGDYLDFSITGKNVGKTAWDKQRLMLVCLISGAAPQFVDYEARRTFARRGSEFVTMNEVIGGKFAPHRMCGIGVSRDGEKPVSRLAAKVSADGKWVLGLAVDRAGSLSFNFQKQTSCIHSNPTWPLLKPGEQATARGHMYFLKGTLDDLWRRYVKDFEASRHGRSVGRSQSELVDQD